MSLLPNCNGAAVPSDSSVTWGEVDMLNGLHLSCPSLILPYNHVGSDPGSLMTGGGLSTSLIQKHKENELNMAASLDEETIYLT